MNIMNIIGSFLKHPDPNDAAQRIVQACMAWGINNRFVQPDYFLDKYIRTIQAYSESYFGKTYFDASVERVKPICIAATLTDVYLSSHMNARMLQVLNELKGQILEVASMIVHDFNFSQKFYECHRFVSREMYLLPPEVDEKIRFITTNTEDWQRTLACAVNWMVQQIVSGKAEHYIDEVHAGFHRGLYEEGHAYMVRASNTVQDIMYDLYM